MVNVGVDTLRSFVREVCGALGSPADESGLVADNLVESNLAGHDSHGVGMLPLYARSALAGKLDVGGHPAIVIDRGPVVVLDGNRGFGAVNGHRAMELAIQRARAHGVALVGLRNSFHIGRIGHWGEECARAGLVSVHFVNVVGHPPLVAPHGGAEARLLTNPFCVAIPGREGSPAALLDFATSKIALGKARVAANTNAPVPAGTLIDGHGRFTTDPHGILEQPPIGALVAMGEHKGSGLALMCELVGAALIGGSTEGPGREQDGAVINNMTTIAIDPDSTGVGDALVHQAAELVDHVRSTPPREGFSEVLAPGDPEQRKRIERRSRMPVDETTLAQLRQVGRAVGLADPEARLR